MGARVRLPAVLECLTRTQLIRVIRESKLCREDTQIARRYLVERIPQIDIAVEMHYDRKTISRRIPHIIEAACATAGNIYK